MEEYIQIQDKKYKYVSRYRNNKEIRRSFNELALKTFDIDFEEWYKDGYWSDRYMPYSLLDKEKVVANVSISIVDILIDGDKKKYMQIGTVMVDKNYRGLGLSKALMEKVLSEWENKCDLIYLYANDSILNFYPKFGFEKYDEYQYSITKTKYKDERKARKLDIENNHDKEILKRLVTKKISISRVTEENNLSLIMFYCLDYMKDNIYYIEEYDVAAICEYKDDTLVIVDIFTENEINLDRVSNILMEDRSKRVVLGFTPINTSSYDKELLKEEDTTLFIRSKGDNPFKDNKIMFPILSHT